MRYGIRLRLAADLLQPAVAAEAWLGAVAGEWPRDLAGQVARQVRGLKDLPLALLLDTENAARLPIVVTERR